MEANPVVTPIDPDTLSLERRSKPLESVNLIKENICVKIKGMTYGDGSKQNKYLQEGEGVFRKKNMTKTGISWGSYDIHIFLFYPFKNICTSFRNTPLY